MRLTNVVFHCCSREALDYMAKHFPELVLKSNNDDDDDLQWNKPKCTYQIAFWNYRYGTLNIDMTAVGKYKDVRFIKE